MLQTSSFFLHVQFQASQHFLARSVEKNEKLILITLIFSVTNVFVCTQIILTFLIKLHVTFALQHICNILPF